MLLELLVLQGDVLLLLPERLVLDRRCFVMSCCLPSADLERRELVAWTPHVGSVDADPAQVVLVVVGVQRLRGVTLVLMLGLANYTLRFRGGGVPVPAAHNHRVLIKFDDVVLARCNVALSVVAGFVGSSR